MTALKELGPKGLAHAPFNECLVWSEAGLGSWESNVHGCERWAEAERAW